MKAYISCPVHFSQDRLHLMPVIEKIVQSKGIDTFVFQVGGVPKDIFERDFKAISTSDLLITEVSEPSHGVGAEIGMSFCLNLKRILLLEKGKQVSRLVQGMPNTTIIEYENLEDLKSKLLAALPSKP